MCTDTATEDLSRLHNRARWDPDPKYGVRPCLTISLLRPCFYQVRATGYVSWFCDSFLPSSVSFTTYNCFGKRWRYIIRSIIYMSQRIAIFALCHIWYHLLSTHSISWFCSHFFKEFTGHYIIMPTSLNLRFMEALCRRQESCIFLVVVSHLVVYMAFFFMTMKN